jgi:BioD-like phosphotransacetylase family protein
MVKTLYVSSTQVSSGKTAVCAGLLRRFHQDGLRVGYMKPVCTQTRLSPEQGIDEDTRFMKETFGLADPLEEMAPVTLTDKRLAAFLAGESEDFRGRVRSALASIGKGKDVVVLEGGASLREGWIIDLAPPQTAKLLDAQGLEVVPYQSDLQVVDDLITARVRLEDRLLGAVVNRVPKQRLAFVQDQVRPYVEERGVPLFAIFPLERVLLSVSVAELSEGLAGQVLCCEEGLGELVEHVLVGAMSVDTALVYFRRKPNKAVVTGGDRSDIQLAALETSTRCLILTGNIHPTPQVMMRAEDRNVPIILTRHDTMTTVGLMEPHFGAARFHQTKKIHRFEKLVEKHMDFEGLCRALGLS